MMLTMPTQKLIRILDDLLIKSSVAGGQICFTPSNAKFTNAYFRSTICYGEIDPSFFNSYNVETEETLRFTATMLSNIKKISDENVSIITSQDNIQFRGESTDSYTEPMSTLEEEIPIEFTETEYGVVPILDEEALEIVTAVLLKRADMSMLPSAEEYTITVLDDVLRVTVSKLGNFVRNVNVEKTYLSGDVSVLIDKDNFNFAFTGHADVCKLLINPQVLVTNYESDGYKLTLVTSTQRV